MMNELVNELNQVMDTSYERIARKTKWTLYFERLKANNVKEVFRVDFRTYTIRYYYVNHKTPLATALKNYATDEIQFETADDILDYLYGA